MKLRPRSPAPIFTGTAVIGGGFKEISLRDYAGKYVVFFFCPLDFTFMKPDDVMDFSAHARDFRDIGTELIACSTESHYSHLAWVNTALNHKKFGKLNIPLLADKSMKISRAYGVLNEENGLPYRGLFIIDRNQKLRQIAVNDYTVGHDVGEVYRLVKTLQFSDEDGDGASILREMNSKQLIGAPMEPECFSLIN